MNIKMLFNLLRLNCFKQYMWITPEAEEFQRFRGHFYLFFKLSYIFLYTFFIIGSIFSIKSIQAQKTISLKGILALSSYNLSYEKQEKNVKQRFYVHVVFVFHTSFTNLKLNTF